MKPTHRARLFCGALLFTSSGAALAQDDHRAIPQNPQPNSQSALHDIIIVTQSRTSLPTEMRVTGDDAPVHGSDVTHLAARIPGGARIANGALSGQMQYRGLFGERLNLRVDGQHFASGGPNLMDPVFHYAPAPLVDTVIIDRGISPVSAGPGLAGGANAGFKRVAYSNGTDIEFDYDLTLGGRSINDGMTAGGIAGWATDSWRFNLLGAQEDGNDSGFDGGTIGGTAYERGVFGLSAGRKTPWGELTLDMRRQNTEPSGTPPFPMDIRYFDTDFLRLGYRRQIGRYALEAHVHGADVAHVMDNFSQRPDPADPKFRASYADATTKGADVKLGFDAFGGDLELGLDTVENEHHVTITNPNNPAFRVTPFPLIEMQRLGGFAEWHGELGRFNAQIGGRLDGHDYRAGQAAAEGVMQGPVNLAAAFNAAMRDGDDVTFDLAARFWTPVQGGLSWRFTLAHKQKMPGYIQRFGWLPITASGGLADGNIYVGDLTLEKETALIAEVGVDYTTPRSYWRPTIFLRDIEDYIQGTPVSTSQTLIRNVAMMNGDSSPLQWGNVKAQLYGFDMDMGHDFTGPLRLDAVVNYVRGIRRDLDDELYRIAPLNATLGLTWQRPLWSLGLELRAVAAQKKVSVTNEEQSTQSYQLVNINGKHHLSEKVKLAFGIENLLDEEYRNHLSGINRNGFGDVGTDGTRRVPGDGRGFFIRLSMTP